MAQVHELRSIQSVLQQLPPDMDNNTEPWQQLTLLLLVQLKRKCARAGIEACLSEDVLALLLRVLPKALPDAAPVLKAIKPQTQAAMLRPPSHLCQTVENHVFAAVPTIAAPGYPNLEGKRVLRMLSAALLEAAMSVIMVDLNGPAQEFSLESESSVMQPRQSLRRPSQACCSIQPRQERQRQHELSQQPAQQIPPQQQIVSHQQFRRYTLHQNDLQPPSKQLLLEQQDFLMQTQHHFHEQSVHHSQRRLQEQDTDPGHATMQQDAGCSSHSMISPYESMNATGAGMPALVSIPATLANTPCRWHPGGPERPSGISVAERVLPSDLSPQFVSVEIPEMQSSISDVTHFDTNNSTS